MRLRSEQFFRSPFSISFLSLSKIVLTVSYRYLSLCVCMLCCVNVQQVKIKISKGRRKAAEKVCAQESAGACTRLLYSRGFKRGRRIGLPGADGGVAVGGSRSVPRTNACWGLLRRSLVHRPMISTLNTSTSTTYHDIIVSIVCIVGVSLSYDNCTVVSPVFMIASNRYHMLAAN